MRFGPLRQKFSLLARFTRISINTEYLFQGIPLSINGETSDIEFRFYGLNYTDKSSFRVDDVRLYVVPEPASPVLAVLGILGLVRARRSRE